MCKQGDTIILDLKCPHSISYTAQEKIIPRDIDSCIAPIVKALNDANIYTVASCCGHDKKAGMILLADGRQLIIMRNFNRAIKEVKKINREPV